MIRINKMSIIDSCDDVIVNAANSLLQEGGGVCGAIFEAAGRKQLQEACDRIGSCPTGKAVITPGFRLSRFIVHAVGPIYQGGEENEAEDLYNAYISSLNLVKENECHRVCFPLISAGIYGYPLKEAWQIALRACDQWQKDNEDYEVRITFAVLDEKIRKCGEETANELGITV